MDKHITYIFPSRSRPDNFFKCLDNIINFSISDRFLIICVLDSNDKTMNGSEVGMKILRYQNEGINVLATWGTSKSKIHACNREVGIIGETDIVALQSDDFIFTKPGFDMDIREAYADGFKGCVHFPDGRVDNEPKSKHATGFYVWMMLHSWTFSPIGNGAYASANYDQKYTLPALYQLYYTEQKKRLITFPIMHREYLEIDKWIYHPRFLSVCSDDFMTELSKKRGQYKFVDKNIMEHRHYRNGFGEPDELMKHNDSGVFYKHDREVLNELREEFGL